MGVNGEKFWPGWALVPLEMQPWRFPQSDLLLVRVFYGICVACWSSWWWGIRLCACSPPPRGSPPLWENLWPLLLCLLFSPPFFIWQPTLVEYFTSFFVIRVDMGSLNMCSLLGDFPRMQPLSHLVSNQILFNLLSIYSRMCLSRDVPTFYMQSCTSKIFSNVCIQISCQNKIRIKSSRGHEIEN